MPVVPARPGGTSPSLFPGDAAAHLAIHSARASTRGVPLTLAIWDGTWRYRANSGGRDGPRPTRHLRKNSSNWETQFERVRLTERMVRIRPRTIQHAGDLALAVTSRHPADVAGRATNHPRGAILARLLRTVRSRSANRILIHSWPVPSSETNIIGFSGGSSWPTAWTTTSRSRTSCLAGHTARWMRCPPVPRWSARSPTTFDPAAAGGAAPAGFPSIPEGISPTLVETLPRY
jgi:hypothetical protein